MLTDDNYDAALLSSHVAMDRWHQKEESMIWIFCALTVYSLFFDMAILRVWASATVTALTVMAIFTSGAIAFLQFIENTDRGHEMFRYSAIALLVIGQSLCAILLKQAGFDAYGYFGIAVQIALAISSVPIARLFHPRPKFA
jgi:hypothetical protein